MSWFLRNWSNGRDISSLTGQHVYLALVPVVLGLVIAVPLGWLATRSPLLRGVFFYAFGFLYTIPSLALLVVLPGLLGTRILDPVNVIAALTIYTIALLVRSVADALAAVPGEVVAAATAIGYRPVRRFFTVEFPLAVPVVVAGLRVATVSNISLVSVGALIGVGGLGDLFTDGFQLGFIEEIVVGVIACLVLAFAADLLLLLAGRVLSPWTRVVRAR